MPPLWTDVVSAIGNCLVAVAAIVATITGIIGFRQWRHELLGKTKHEVARRLSFLAFRFNEEFTRVRNPITLAGESINRTKGEQETDNEALIQNEYYAKSKRLNELNKIVEEIRQAGWEAETLIDPVIAEFVSPIIDNYVNLAASIVTHFRMQMTNAKRPDGALVSESAPDLTLKVYGIPSDEIGCAVESAVKALVLKLSVYLR